MMSKEDLSIPEILKTEYSERFDEIRKNAMANSYYKYGPARKNYVNGNINAILSMQKCIDKYRDTGNTEYLCDAANYLMLEFMYPQHKKAHYKATTAESDSAGIVGISVNEMEALRREEECGYGVY